MPEEVKETLTKEAFDRVAEGKDKWSEKQRATASMARWRAER